MTTSKASERKIRQRKKLVMRIVKFAYKVIEKYGKQTYYSQGSCNTHTKAELMDVGGFSFKYDCGQTMLGGNDVKVLYRGDLVFHLYHQCFSPKGDDCRVNLFQSGDWPGKLNKLMKNIDKMITKKKKAEESPKPNGDAREQEKLQKLKEESERLGL